eukprot:11395349-Alexandrium_andersonii.AAC.1
MQEQGMTHRRAWQRINAEVGRYINIYRLAEAFGFSVNPEEALAAAERYAAKCNKLRGPWVAYDKMSEQVMYLYLEVAARNKAYTGG